MANHRLSGGWPGFEEVGPISNGLWNVISGLLLDDGQGVQFVVLKAFLVLLLCHG